jgi:RNA polymerase sigma-70 factor (ECF subfamily)
LVLTARQETAEEMGGLLRRFGMALARDNKLVCDDCAARALVDNLSRRALIAARNGEGPGEGDARLRLFALFIRFYRRHARLAAAEEAASEAAPPARLSAFDSREGAANVERAVRNLPLELRESLLLVVLERFSHAEAAQALEIPLATLIERLARGRGLLAAALARKTDVAPSRLRAQPPLRGAPHLRLVK